MAKKEKFPYHEICSKCAEKKGGTWPEGHCATCWMGVCPYCGKEAGLCALGDWNWSDGKRRGMWD